MSSDVQSGKRRLVEARVLRKRHPQQYVEYPDCTDAGRSTDVLAQFDEPFVDPAELVAERFPESRPVAHRGLPSHSRHGEAKFVVACRLVTSGELASVGSAVAFTS